jgi:hypothetical protein
LESSKFDKSHRVVIDDAVRDQTGAFAPDLLFLFGLKAQLAEIGVGNGSAQLMIILAAVESPLDIAAKRCGVNVIEKVGVTA